MVWITQLLCPERHCLIAVAWDDKERTSVDGDALIKVMSEKMALRPWCALCGSKQLHTEHGKTSWTTMEEALPHIKATEAANIASRALLEHLGATYDQKRNN